MSLALIPHDPPAPPAGEPGINKQHKAAILLSALIKADASPDLDGTATVFLKDIADIMASYGDVKRHTIDLVILEFLSELQDFGLSMRAAPPETLLLALKYAPTEAEFLLSGLSLRIANNYGMNWPKWEQSKRSMPKRR
ncbi:MAG: hypothetical protein ABGW81_10910 [Paracoccaceae bacterium]